MILELVNTWMLAHRHVLSLKAVYFDAALSPLILVFPWMSNSNVRMRLRDYLEGRQLYNGKLHNLSNRWVSYLRTWYIIYHAHSRILGLDGSDISRSGIRTQGGHNTWRSSWGTLFTISVFTLIKIRYGKYR